ncbi:MAG: sulfatase-like hydrolase/transferase [Lawsonibacter sp.]|jgi:phosphoglycerol transferase MdoB-like AlkP superfamily enzyme
MKTLLTIFRLPRGSDPRWAPWHTLWLAVALTGLGCCVGGLALFYAATAYLKLNSLALLYSYLTHPLILFLNLLPPVLLIWLGYFLTRRAWVGFLCSFLPVVGLAMANYFKIRLRSDPLLAADLRLAAEAGGIVGGYSLDINWLTWFTLVCFFAGLLFSIFLMPNGLQGRWNRLFGATSCLALMAVAMVTLYLNPSVYNKTENNRFINQWSDVELYLSKGCTYPFLYSFKDMFPTPPPGYDEAAAAALLASFPDEDIPPERQVSVLGVMLEAFCDLTDFPALGEIPAVEQVYAPWHQLEEDAVSGNLLTNIFAGGTVDSEWAFLTGYSEHQEFRKNTDSYVWYLRDQGYRTLFSHPGYGWFYNRQNVVEYLGFEESWFTENHYGDLVDPTSAIYHSDHILAQELLKQLKTEIMQGPCFSFAVSYQNHGPYESTYTAGAEYLSLDTTGFSPETCNIWNNYLSGVSETIDAMTNLAQGLEEIEEPVILVLFGDHKPWGGNGNVGYAQLGIDFDLSTTQGFYDYYSTPYLIWANSAAKAALGYDFIGEGGDFSPCFLMPKLFDLCDWEGPSFLQLSRQIRQITPLLHVQNLYWQQDSLTDMLSPTDADAISSFLGAQYYRETQISPET